MNVISLRNRPLRNNLSNLGFNSVGSVKFIPTALNCGIPWLIRELIMMLRLEILIAPVIWFREMRSVGYRIVHLIPLLTVQISV